MKAVTAGRPGVTLVETLMALVLAALVASLCSGLLTAQLRLARATAARAVEREALRTATTVLGAELRRITPADIGAFRSDSVALRALRGLAIPCAATPLGAFVRYTGDRAPDPAKDSILVVARDAETAVELIDSTPASGSCGARTGESIFQWRLAQPIADTALLLLFESGSYHLSSQALRYRSGAGGRQPLTPEVFLHPATRFDTVDSTALRFTIEAGALRARGAAMFPPPPR